MTKKNVLLISFIGTVIIVILAVLSMSGFCYHNTYCLDLFRKFNPWKFVSFLFFTPPVFLLSLITYKMHDDFFWAWMKFAMWWIPISAILSLLALSKDDGGGGFFISFSADGLFTFLMIPFTLISFFIVFWKYLSFSDKKEGQKEKNEHPIKFQWK